MSARAKPRFDADALARLAGDKVFARMAEAMFDAAWSTVAPPDLQRDLALASEASHPEAAIRVYTAHIERCVALGGNPAYAEAGTLLGRMARLRDPAAQAAHVLELRTRLKARRNFMKLLA